MEDSSCARTSSRDTTRHALAHEEFARYFHGSAVERLSAASAAARMQMRDEP
jgi:hypothetical protein